MLSIPVLGEHRLSEVSREIGYILFDNECIDEKNDPLNATLINVSKFSIFHTYVIKKRESNSENCLRSILYKRHVYKNFPYGSILLNKKLSPYDQHIVYPDPDSAFSFNIKDIENIDVDSIVYLIWPEQLPHPYHRGDLSIILNQGSIQSKVGYELVAVFSGKRNNIAHGTPVFLFENPENIMTGQFVGFVTSFDQEIVRIESICKACTKINCENVNLKISREVYHQCSSCKQVYHNCKYRQEL